jgi:hypothetical protein
MQPPPKFILGQKCLVEAAQPPWTERPVTMTIDGMRLETNYEETWASEDEDAPCVLVAQAGEWHYHLVHRGPDRHGNDSVYDWGWAKESQIEPLPKAEGGAQ